MFPCGFLSGFYIFLIKHQLFYYLHHFLRMLTSTFMCFYPLAFLSFAISTSTLKFHIFIITSGCSWPSATVKSRGFFKLGSCFSFFYKLLTFLFFYFYVFFIFNIILYNKNKVFLFHLYIYIYLDASLKFGKRRHTSFFFK